MTNEPITIDWIMRKNCPPNLDDRRAMIVNIKAYAAQEVAKANQNGLVWHPIETFPDFYPAPLLIKKEDPEEGLEYGLAEWSGSGECWVDPKFTGIKENYTHWAYIDRRGGERCL